MANLGRRVEKSKIGLIASNNLFYILYGIGFAFCCCVLIGLELLGVRSVYAMDTYLLMEFFMPHVSV